jgi:hypothetical protein
MTCVSKDDKVADRGIFALVGIVIGWVLQVEITRSSSVKM